MPTALDLIGSNSALQDHWFRRIFAFIIDAILVGIVWFVIAIFLRLPFLDWLIAPFGFGVLMWLYATVFEGSTGGTIGKKLLGLQVVPISGHMSLSKGFTRNISKIFWLLLLIDWIFGFVTLGDPRQRYLDRIAYTTVSKTGPHAYVEEQFRKMQYVPPHPHVPPEAWAQPPAQQPAQPAQPQPQAPAAERWPHQQAPPSEGWPKHEWDEEGRLKPQMRFCSSCGAQLIPRGDGKLTCVRCGLVY